MDRMREFTLQELAEFDGQDGKPVYVAFGGTVYDVSESDLWNKGSHFNRHLPANDLTEQMGSAPHGADVLDRPGIEAVGILKRDPAEGHIPPFLESIYQRFPSLRRHTHAATVHFPIAYLTAASIFTAVDLLFPGFFGVDYEKIAFIMLVLAAVFTPVTIVTGVVSWWVNYQLRPSRRIRNLIGLSVVIVVLEAICLFMRVPGPVEKEGFGLAYYGIMFLMGPLAGITGFNGGQLVFPTHKG